MAGLTLLFREVGVKGACARTIGELLEELGIERSEGILGAVVTLSALLKENNLEVLPPLTKGDLDTVRTVRFGLRYELSSEHVVGEIANGEGGRQEFKATLQFDLKRYAAQPNQPLSVYRSEEVLHSTLKTIAAFLNTEGGILYVGVNDQGEVIGLDNDYRLPQATDRDQLQLFLRDCIATRFYDGPMVSDLIDARFLKVDGRDVLRLDVIPRQGKLSLLKRPAASSYQLYRRDGNRTVEVGMEHVEEFVCRRIDRGGRFPGR